MKRKSNQRKRLRSGLRKLARDFNVPWQARTFAGVRPNGYGSIYSEGRTLVEVIRGIALAH
jgi:hypothetical protein